MIKMTYFWGACIKIRKKSSFIDDLRLIKNNKKKEIDCVRILLKINNEGNILINE